MSSLWNKVFGANELEKNPTETVRPDLPEQASNLPGLLPLNDEQQQWAAGFLAGLQTQLLQSGVTQSASAQQVQRPVTILFGSQTGNAEGLAGDCAELAKADGLLPEVVDMDDFELDRLPNIERLLVVTSTYGEGEMPDNAQNLWDSISEDNAPRLNNTFYSVLALGDTSYDEFCHAGKLWDQRLEELGGNRIVDRVDCDIDYDEPSEAWMNEVVPIIAKKGSDAALEVVAVSNDVKKTKSKYNRKNPLTAKLITKRMLTQAGSSKEVLHYEI
ncbi:MAG: flavodoxin domain-containing protein [Pseudomonadota bacterium]